MPKRDVFTPERNEIEVARELIQRPGSMKEEFVSGLGTLVDSCERSKRSADRITAISDRLQKNMAEERERRRSIRKMRVANGVFWIEIPDADLRILCGCPADTVKLLIKQGLIVKTERNGVTFETGPNAILLSDVMIQNGQIANLAKFPVLQTLYRQGMIVPGHPNNTGAKPMLIGLDEVLRAQAQYIFRGNYGLASIQELEEAGTENDLARDLMRLKMRFAFDSIKSPEEMIDLRPVDRDVILLTNDVYLHRLGVNLYEIIWEGQRVDVDLNLGPREEYESSYVLGDHSIDKHYFSVVHIGEGDGWDVNRPCMSSLLTHKNRLYLIDAGPRVVNSLTALGVGINEIDGIFHTHGHDDHFAGLAALLRADHRLKYFATRLVHASVTKKLSALMSIDESTFGDYFEVHDLVPDEWNDIDGLQTMPIFSPHPVETNIFRFRVRWQEGYRSYAHLADIASNSVLLGMVTEDETKSGIDPASLQRIRESYLKPADIKKIDIGGGLIHGDALDFDRDHSGRILLAHTEHPLTREQREIGSNASFGDQDVLIASAHDPIVVEAFDYLRSYYPEVPEIEIRSFANHRIESHDAGTIMLRKGERGDSIYLIIRGAVEAFDVNKEISRRLTCGALVGEIAGVEGDPVSLTYRAASHVKALRIPIRHYGDFVRRNKLLDSMIDLRERIEFLQSIWLFDEAISHRTLFRIAARITEITIASGQSVGERIADGLFLIASGEVRLIADDHEFESIGNGDLCSEASLLNRDSSFITARTVVNTTGFVVPKDAVDEIPVVRRKLLEVFNRRVRKITTIVGLDLHDEYSLDGAAIDAQHRNLFDSVKGIVNSQREGVTTAATASTVAALIEEVETHFVTE